MPIYEYECPKHGKFEVTIGIKHYDETHTLPCPKCDHESPRQVSTGTTFELKGRGWSDDGYVQGLKNSDPKGGDW